MEADKCRSNFSPILSSLYPYSWIPGIVPRAAIVKFCSVLTEIHIMSHLLVCIFSRQGNPQISRSNIKRP